MRLLRIDAKQAGEPFCELSVEGCSPEKCAPAPRGKVPECDSHFSFFVGEPATAALTLRAFVAVTHSIANKAANMVQNSFSLSPTANKGGKASAGSFVSEYVPAGSVQISLSEAMWEEGRPFPPARWYDLSEGGRVRLQLFIIRAPPPDAAHGGRGDGHTLSVLVGTWNVGNERPPTDLSQWLDVGVKSKGSGNVGGSDIDGGDDNDNDPFLESGGSVDSDPFADPADDPFDDSVAGKSGESDGESFTKRSSASKERNKAAHVAGVPSPDSDAGDCVPTEWGTYEMVVVGCQEGDYKERAPHDSCESDWFAGIAATLGDSYVMHCKNTLGQMRIAVFVRADVAPAVHSWHKATEATGLGHVMANKGGVGLACRVWDTSLCFINAHLAAHDDMCMRRNDDFAEIVGGCTFGEKVECTQAFHHLVFMGDLNYRCGRGGAAIERISNPGINPRPSTLDALYARPTAHDPPPSTLHPLLSHCTRYTYFGIE